MRVTTRRAGALAALALAAPSVAAAAAPHDDVLSPSAVAATRDYALVQPGRAAPVETLVRGVLPGGRCVSLRLPQRWTVAVPEPGRIEARAPWAQVEIALRPALGSLASADLARRHADLLQRGYEDLIGKPAQAVSLEPAGQPGALRWRGTWIDGNLPGASRAISLETFILPLEDGAALALTLDDAELPPVHDALAERAVETLRIEPEGICGEPMAERSSPSPTVTP